MNPSETRTPGADKRITPDRVEINRVASELVVQYGGMILKDAIEFSSNPSDAEDAYQRSVEILLTKAPSTDPDELIPWLRTVVRREARDIAIRHHNRDVSLSDEISESIASRTPSPETMAESFAVLEIGAEALGKLTPDQVKCVLAQNDGLEYDEIAELTGFTRRKVSRCLEKARVAFAHNVEAITAGSECERIEPLLHRLLDGDSDAAIEVRPHLRHCLACRARLREYENAPRRIAALFPPAFIMVGRPAHDVVSRIGDWWQSIGDRASTHLLGADRWAEASSVKKLGVVALLATATISGGAAVHKVATEDGPKADHRPAAGQIVPESATPHLLDVVKVSRPNRHKRKKSATKHLQHVSTTRAAPAQPAPAPAPKQTNTPVDDGSAEFLPEERAGN